jgi:hypothetical protein
LVLVAWLLVVNVLVVNVLVVNVLVVIEDLPVLNRWTRPLAGNVLRSFRHPVDRLHPVEPRGPWDYPDQPRPHPPDPVDHAPR